MNRIVLDREVEKDLIVGDDLIVIEDDKDLFLILEKDFTAKVIVSPNKDLKVTVLGKDITLKVDLQLEESAKVLVNSFLTNSNVDLEVNLIGVDASIEYNLGMISDSKKEIKNTINHECSNTNSSITNHLLAKGKKESKVIINGIVLKNSKNCQTNQDTKIITLEDNESLIEPNLIIDNKDTIASHSAYIGRYKESDLFYLMSRGLKREDAIRLLSYSYLLGKMDIDDERINEFKDIIDDFL